jgi:hypothetical protein
VCADAPVPPPVKLMIADWEGPPLGPTKIFVPDLPGGIAAPEASSVPVVVPPELARTAAGSHAQHWVFHGSLTGKNPHFYLSMQLGVVNTGVDWSAYTGVVLWVKNQLADPARTTVVFSQVVADSSKPVDSAMHPEAEPGCWYPLVVPFSSGDYASLDLTRVAYFTLIRSVPTDLWVDEIYLY